MAVAGSPADGQPAAVQAAFARLRERFVAGLPQRWQDIEAAEPGQALQDALHRLVGAAASYGLADLGQAARRAEGLTRDLSAAAKPAQAAARHAPAAALNDAQAAALAGALAEVRRLIDEAVTVR
jgi:HPt (histidine-containing phosphotransfer) domain-containing protein